MRTPTPLAHRAPLARPSLAATPGRAAHARPARSIYESIGKGMHSVVYKGRKKKTIMYYAIKSVQKSQKQRVHQEARLNLAAAPCRCRPFAQRWVRARGACSRRPRACRSRPSMTLCTPTSCASTAGAPPNRICTHRLCNPHPGTATPPRQPIETIAAPSVPVHAVEAFVIAVYGRRRCIGHVPPLSAVLPYWQRQSGSRDSVTQRPRG